MLVAVAFHAKQISTINLTFHHFLFSAQPSEVADIMKMWKCSNSN